MRPKARREGLIVQQVDEETIVYDEERDRVHCLNALAAAVWQRSDGRRDVEGLARRVGQDLGAAVEVEAVHLALGKLHKAKLVDTAAPGRSTAVGRRAALRRLGTAALVPIVSTIVAPRASEAATLVADGGCCSNAQECASRHCVAMTSANCPGTICPGANPKCCVP
jgi:hypothetical protein